MLWQEMGEGSRAGAKWPLKKFHSERMFPGSHHLSVASSQVSMISPESLILASDDTSSLATPDSSRSRSTVPHATHPVVFGVLQLCCCSVTLRVWLGQEFNLTLPKAHRSTLVNTLGHKPNNLTEHLLPPQMTHNLEGRVGERRTSW